MTENSEYEERNFQFTDITSLSATATAGDFKDGNTTNNDYLYDENGNLVADLNKIIKKLATKGFLHK